ncbi:MAG: hypothetical protein SF123_26405 [Chloroflexota bacterium]|nr:hypothetical protein [Chloroflexota bacterium]
MSAKNPYTIYLEPEQWHRLEETADRLGWDSVGDYVVALLDMDTSPEAEEERQQLLDDLREGYRESLAGDVAPLSINTK